MSRKVANREKKQETLLRIGDHELLPQASRREKITIWT